MYRVLFFSLCTILAACQQSATSLTTPVASTTTCGVEDWYAKGVEQGRRGAGIDRFGALTQGCTNLPSDVASAFEEGRQEGLLHYCSNAQITARATEYRNKYNPVCGYSPEKLAAFDRGREIFWIQENAQEYRRDRNQIANSIIRAR